MLIKLFIIQRKLSSIALKPIEDGKDFEFLQGHDMYMEPADDAVRRIAKSIIDIPIDSENLKLVRRESTTVISDGTCSVDSVAVYVYNCHEYGDVELRDTGYDWIPIDRAISDLCNHSKYFEAAYIDEACKV